MTLTHITAYHRPATLADAWALLIDRGDAARLVAGGTDLVTHCPPQVTDLVDLGRVDLGGITRGADGAIEVGALTTFTDLLRHDAVIGHLSGVVSEMLVQVGSPLHRNGATIGGHVARGRLSDVVTVLLALDATVTWFDGDTHTLALVEYYDQQRHRRPHVVTAVGLPAPAAHAAAAFLRFSRTAFDHALLNVACRIDLDRGEVTTATVAGVRVVVGETPDLARPVPAAEAALIAGPLDDDRIGAAAVAARETVPTRGDWAVTAAYRSHLVEVLAGRCLQTVHQRLEGAAS